MTPYIPSYNKPPNKLLRYYTRNVCYHGKKAVETVAVYLDKHKEEREELAHIKWD